jgi:hypothetical protein
MDPRDLRCINILGALDRAVIRSLTRYDLRPVIAAELARAPSVSTAISWVVTVRGLITSIRRLPSDPANSGRNQHQANDLKSQRSLT